MKELINTSPDVILKTYWNDNDRFADFVNTYLFHGERKVTPEELRELNTDMSTLVEYKDLISSEKRARDAVNIAKVSNVTGAAFVILGIENQEYVDYSMPVRVLLYDAINYQKQLQVFRKKMKGCHDIKKNEFMSKMRKTDILIPVYTIVIYFGDKPWDGPKSLHEMFGPNYKEEFPYINDYHLNLLEVRNQNLVFNNKNNADLFSIMKIFYDESLSKNERCEKAIRYTQDNKTSDEVILTAAKAANLNIDYKKINTYREGGELMCQLFDDIASEAKLEGRLEGELDGGIRTYIESCREFNVAEADIPNKVMVKFQMDREQISPYLEKYL